MTADRIKPVLRYPGAKWRIADWIVSFLPAHAVYVEPFAGSAAVLLAKQRAPHETISDVDGRVTNLFRVIRERPEELAAAVLFTPYARSEFEASMAATEPDPDPVEEARRFLIRVWMAHGGKLGARAGWRQDRFGRIGVSMPSQWRNLPDRVLVVADRLRDVHVECRPALDVVEAFADPSVLIYADPPYVFDGRYERSTRYYTHEMDTAGHTALLDALDRHPGPVALSGYRSAIYDRRLDGWRRVDRDTVAYRGGARVESLWLNPAATAKRDLFALAGVAVPA